MTEQRRRSHGETPLSVQPASAFRPWGARVPVESLAKLYRQGGCHRAKAIMGLSLIARLETKRWCRPPQRRALYRAIEEAIEMGQGPFGSRLDRRDIEAHALNLPALLRRLLSIATKIERSHATHRCGPTKPAIDAAARADLAALIQFDPGHGFAIQSSLFARSEDIPVLIRKAVARIRVTYGGKGRRPGHRFNFVPVVGLAARAYDIAESDEPRHFSITMAPGEKRPPLTLRDGQETGPRVRFTRALLQVAFPGINLGPAEIRNALDRLARDNCRRSATNAPRSLYPPRRRRCS